jgi:hypothetical protein
VKEDPMIQAQINSLALTPDPIVLENLPPAQAYNLHTVFHEIYKQHGVKMLPIPEDFERRIDEAIKKLSLTQFNKKLEAFCDHLEKYSANKIQLYLNLIEVLEPTGERRFLNKTGDAVEVPAIKKKSNCDVVPGREIAPRPMSDYALGKPRLAKKRGEKWKVDDRWVKVWPSSRAVIKELWFRTHLSKIQGTFPYAYAGIESLMKVTGFSEKQVRRALKQLQALGFICRMFRAYKGMGASKYWVFLTPGMSGAFFKKTKGGHKK